MKLRRWAVLITRGKDGPVIGGKRCWTHWGAARYKYYAVDRPSAILSTMRDESADKWMNEGNHGHVRRMNDLHGQDV